MTELSNLELRCSHFYGDDISKYKLEKNLKNLQMPTLLNIATVGVKYEEYNTITIETIE